MAIGYGEELDELQAASLRGLASPHRVRLVHVLSAGPRDVRDISAALHLEQAATSQHLAALRALGIVEASRDGRTVSYQLSDPSIANACELMRAVLVRRLARLGHLAATAEPRPPLPTLQPLEATTR